VKRPQRQQAPPSPQQIAAQAAYEAAEDELIAGLVGVATDDEDEPAPAAVAAPKAAPKPADDDDDDPEEVAETAADEAGTDDAEDDETETEYETALRGLKLHNTPEDVLQGLSKDKAIAWWANRKAAEAETTRHIAKLRGQIEALQTGGAERKGAQPAQPEQRADIDAAMQRVEEEYGPDGRAAIAGVVTPLQQEIAELKRTLQSRDLERASATARAKVGERFPDLLDDARWSSAQRYMSALSALPEFHEIEAEHGIEAALASIAEAAARATGMAERKPRDTARQQQIAAAKQAGAPSRTTRNALDAPPANPAEREDWIMKMIRAGKSSSEIRALNGGKPW
jgi:hypothetical protein